RMLRGLCLSIAVAMGLVLSPATVSCAEADAKADQTLKARAILRKYCVECHHPGDGSVGDLSVLDRPGLDRAERPFLVPGAADASQLMQLIDDGSMPPGTHRKPTAEERQVLRAWINADAASFPKQFDDEYAYAAILADVKTLSEAERPLVRYFSLHNLIPDA